MRKFYAVFLAMLMVFGFSAAASAALVLNFDIDFHTTGLSNAVHSYTKGDTDTGQTIDLQPCESVWVDFYADVLTSDGLTGADFTLTFNPATLEATQAVQGPNFLYITPPSVGPGFAHIEDLSFVSIVANDILLGSVLLHCTGPGLDPLVLSGTFVSTSGVDPVYFNNLVVGSINNVPIPGAIWLLGSGLIGLVAKKRKIK
jgi:hypothetical protein